MASIQAKKIVASVTLAMITAVTLAVVQATPLTLFADPLAGEASTHLDLATFQVGEQIIDFTVLDETGQPINLSQTSSDQFSLVAILDKGDRINWEELDFSRKQIQVFEVHPGRRLKYNSKSKSHKGLLLFDPDGYLRYKCIQEPTSEDWALINHLIKANH